MFDVHWSIYFLFYLALSVFIVRAVRQWWQDRKLDNQMKKLTQIGYVAGQNGMPPDFHDRMDTNFDTIDQIAIMQGWDAGWAEFEDLPEEKRAILKSINESKFGKRE
jgi:hypothetical protein